MLFLEGTFLIHLSKNEGPAKKTVGLARLKMSVSFSECFNGRHDSPPKFEIYNKVYITVCLVD
jgi:hypothetical protein